MAKTASAVFRKADNPLADAAEDAAARAARETAEKAAREAAERAEREVAERAAREAAEDRARREAAEATGTPSAHGTRADPAASSTDPATCTTTTDPVDVATGRVLMTQTDVSLPGTLPLRIRRTHVSDYQYGRAFGHRWASTLDVRLEADDQGVILLREDGVALNYPSPTGWGAVYPIAGDPWPLEATSTGYRALDPVNGLTWHFDDTTGRDLAPVGGSDSARVVPVSAITRRAGDRVMFLSDGSGRVLELVHSGGYRVRVDWDDHLDRVVALTLLDADGANRVLRQFGHDHARRLTSVVDGTGLPMRLAYDHHGRLTRWTDRNGCWYAYTYDNHGRCVAGTGPDGYLATTLVFDPTNRASVVTDATGHQTTYTTNQRNQVIRVVDPVGSTWTREWDARGRVLEETDPLGRRTRYQYDDLGRVVGTVDPDGGGSAAAYTPDGLPLWIRDRAGATHTIVRDQHGNPTSVTDPLGATTHHGYDDNGHLAHTTDPLGATTTVTCDGAGLPIQVVDPTGATTLLERDPAGRVVRVVDAAGGVMVLAHDAEGRLVSRTAPDGATETWEYDPEGNSTAHTSPVGAVTRFEYTHFDRLTTRIDPDGARVGLAHDRQLRLATVTNPIGLTWTYVHDPAGNLTSETDFDGRTLTYAHDVTGATVAVTNGLGQTTQLVRDQLGRLIARDAPEGRTSYQYDPVGRLVRATSPTVDLLLSRDRLGRVTAETVDGRTTSTSYDAAGRVTARRTPSGLTSTWTHDPRGHAVSLTTADHTLALTHDALGNLVDQTLVTPTSWQILHHTHDPVGRLLSQTLHHGHTGQPTSRIVTHTGYAHRPDGYLIATVDETGDRRDLTLDPAGRITTVTARDWSERYAYGPTGDIVHAQWPDGQDPNPARGEREYSGTLIRRAGQVRYEHDAQGRVTLRQRAHHSGKPDTWRYTWDSEDRLVAVRTPDGTTWSYRYDPLGRRIGKYRHAPNGGVDERLDLTWDGPRLVESLRWNPDGTVNATTWDYRPDTFTPITQTNRSWLATEPQTEIDRRYHTIITDLVGTPTYLIGTKGDVRWQTRTTIWGTTVATWGVQPAIAQVQAACPIRFPGQYHDQETGHYYNNQRNYDHTTARYLTLDPLGLAPAPHPNRYVPNPTTDIDPLGLEGCPKVVVENQAGRFGDLDPGIPGDGLTGHHMPQDALHFLPRNKGGAIVMTHADHLLTRTYGGRGRATALADAGLPFRTVLARDIVDLRRIGQQQYGDPGHFNSGIRGLLAYYRSIGQL